MVAMHWSMMAFAFVINSVIFFILGAMDGVDNEPEAFYTPEEDAYWAEYVRVLESRRSVR